MSDFSDRPFVAGVLTGLRAFRVDTLGRLTGVTYKDVWTPGENAAQCHKKDETEAMYGGYMTSPSPVPGCGCRDCTNMSAAVNAHSITSMFAPVAAKVAAAVKAEHTLASLNCQCGFYAYFDGGNDYLRDDFSAMSYAGMFLTRTEDKAARVGAIVNAWGKATVGSRGFRAEKAEIVALIVPSGTAARHEVAFTKARRNYPDVQVFDTEKDAVRAFPLTDAAPYTPETDPDFWTRSVS